MVQPATQDISCVAFLRQNLTERGEIREPISKSGSQMSRYA